MINNKLKIKERPFEEKETETYFYNNLENININILLYPEYLMMRETCIAFCNATWKDYGVDNDYVNSTIKNKVQEKFMYHILKGKIFPGTLENVKITFLINGLSMQDITHFSRYRNAIHSIECSGDKYMHQKNFVIPTSIENSKLFLKRWTNICLEIKELYKDMIDSNMISPLDAKNIFPKCTESFMYISMDLKNLLYVLINDRIDDQMQPQSDNVIAYKLIIELIKIYPIISLIIDIDKPSKFYEKTARQYRSTSWFRPNKNNDTFEYNEDDFLYCERDKLLGIIGKIDIFTKIKDNTRKQIYEVREKYLKNNNLTIKYLESDFTKEEVEFFDK